MPTRTLLELTQDVLSSLESDEVNTISDTTESLQVVRIIRRVYETMVPLANLPEHMSLFQLTASGDADKPTLMFVPTDIKKVLWVKYNKETTTNTDMDFELVTPLSIEDFVHNMHSLAESDTNVQEFNHTIGSDTHVFMCRNDFAPTYYASFDDYTLVFDSYDNTVDTTLQKSKTSCFGVKDYTWTESDTFTPDLDADQFPLLLNEAISLAWAEMKQTQHAKAEKMARRGWINLQTGKNRLNTVTELQKLPNYGRK